MDELSKDVLIDRNNRVFRLVRYVNKWGYKHLGVSHLQMHDEIYRIKQENGVILYTGLHKSLWETTGLLVSLYIEKLPLPFAGMGDNLVKGKFFQELARKTGVFLIKRASNRRELLESAKKLKNYIMTFLAYGDDVLVFPEGTRKSVLSTGGYGKFFPAGFDAVLDYEKNKDAYLANDKDLVPLDTYIVPVNVDYSRVREDWEMINTFKGNPPTLHILDSLKMAKKVGDTYITFGKPMKTTDYIDMSRKDLSVLVREKCLELVKVLPINVVARAALYSQQGDGFDLSAMESNITRVLQELANVKHLFRGVSMAEPPLDVWKRVSKYEKCFRPKHMDIKHLTFYKMYADYIAHYFPS